MKEENRPHNQISGLKSLIAISSIILFAIFELMPNKYNKRGNRRKPEGIQPNPSGSVTRASTSAQSSRTQDSTRKSSVGELIGFDSRLISDEGKSNR